VILAMGAARKAADDMHAFLSDGAAAWHEVHAAASG
jgi:hypothetical protein